MMTSPPSTTVAQLGVRLREQMRDVASLQLALDIQGSRIAQMERTTGGLWRVRKGRPARTTSLAWTPAKPA